MPNCVEFLFGGYLRVAEANSFFANVSLIMSQLLPLLEHTLSVSDFLPLLLLFALFKRSSSPSPWPHLSPHTRVLSHRGPAKQTPQKKITQTPILILCYHTWCLFTIITTFIMFAYFSISPSRL